jgi:hypothetical protein
MYPIYRWAITVDLGYHEETMQGSKMFKEVLSEEEETDFLQYAINGAVMEKDPWTVKIPDDTEDDGYRYDQISMNDLTIHVLDAELEYLGHDEWCLTWFQHYTFDKGQTDEEVLKSFGDFVYNYQNGAKRTQSTLMGAEDRWRWKGMSYPDGENAAGIETDPPCRCQYCKEAGVIRIGH